MNTSRLLIGLMLMIITSLPLFAQTIVVPDTLEGWDQTWVANFNASQATFNNWSEGGVNTVTGTASTVFTRLYQKDRFSYGFRVNLRYGQTRLDDQGVRKSDDLISLRNRFSLNLTDDGIVSAYGNLNLRTQFADGFEFGAAANGGDSLISAFAAPVFITEGLGFTIQPSNDFSADAGLALRQTYVNDPALIANFGVSAGESIRYEGGLTLGLTYQRRLMENLTMATNLETFTNLLIPISDTDVFWSTEITGQINSLLSAIFQFDLRYDSDFSNRVQLKQVFSAGIALDLY